MKKLTNSIIFVLLLSGCVQITGTRKPTGELMISSHRFLWSSEGIVFTTNSGTNGSFSTTLSVQKSSVDSAALGAVAQGVVQGLAASAK